MSEIKNRLRRIAKYIEKRQGKPLIMLFGTPAGEEQAGTVNDFISAKGEFIRVLSGTSLDDLDQFLQHEINNIQVYEL